MTPDIYAEWLRRQGHRVIRTPSSYWQSEGWRVYQAFPYHWLIEPSAEEERELVSRHGATALRYSTPADRLPETGGYHVVFAGPDYDLETLGSWARKNVRRGLRSCTVGQIPFSRYIEEGWALRVDTLARQQRRVPETKDDWHRKNSAAIGLEGFEVWAAEVDHRLAATLLTSQMDGWGYMLYQQCHRDYLREHANNALSFEVTQTLIRRPNIRGIFYGMRSLDAPASVDEFKLRMGYEAKPVRQRVVFHPRLAPLVNRFTHRVAKSLVAVNPASRFLAKAEGMLRLGLASHSASAAEIQVLQISPSQVSPGQVSPSQVSPSQLRRTRQSEPVSRE
jgi:hypothetical protein